jgi:adenosylcobinamide-GDP ribazoletransferase
MNLNPLKIAFSTYSILPMPQADWNRQNIRSAIAYMPLVGCVSGFLLWGWHRLCLLYIPYSLLFAVLATLIPILVSGGIHLDGPMDTCDALASRQSPERKLEIMRDSRVGSFALISLISLLFLELGLWQVLAGSSGRVLATVGCGQILARSLAVLAAGMLPQARKDGMMHDMTAHLSKQRLTIAMLALSLLISALMIAFSVIQGLAAVTGGWLACLIYGRLVRKHFGGVTGDTSGFAVEIIYGSLLLAVAAAEIVLRQI